MSGTPGTPGVVFIRRPNSLLKSPSADSESSDPIKPLMILKTDSTSSSGIHDHRRQRLMALRYRTDSETTDEQCIPDSISEVHDSAMDSAEDIIEDNHEYDDKSPNCDMVQSPAVTHPCINLEVQSSTESDKTVLSIRNSDLPSSVPNSPFSSSPRSSSHNLRLKLSLNLPEIVVQPCSPPQTSPSAESSPTLPSAKVASGKK